MDRDLKDSWVINRSERKIGQDVRHDCENEGERKRERERMNPSRILCVQVGNGCKRQNSVLRKHSFRSRTLIHSYYRIKEQNKKRYEDVSVVWRTNKVKEANERMRKRRADVATPAVSFLKRKKNFQIKNEERRVTDIKEIVKKDSRGREKVKKVWKEESDIKRMRKELRDPKSHFSSQTTPFITFIPCRWWLQSQLGKVIVNNRNLSLTEERK